MRRGPHEMPRRLFWGPSAGRGATGCLWGFFGGPRVPAPLSGGACPSLGWGLPRSRVGPAPLSGGACPALGWGLPRSRQFPPRARPWTALDANPYAAVHGPGSVDSSIRVSVQSCPRPGAGRKDLKTGTSNRDLKQGPYLTRERGRPHPRAGQAPPESGAGPTRERGRPHPREGQAPPERGAGTLGPPKSPHKQPVAPRPAEGPQKRRRGISWGPRRIQVCSCFPLDPPAPNGRNGDPAGFRSPLLRSCSGDFRPPQSQQRFLAICAGNQWIPLIDASVTDAPVTDASVTDASVTDASVADGSVTGGSVTDGSVTEASVTDASVTDASVTDASVTDASCAGNQWNPLISAP
eukprot:gene16485-biopygen5907